MPRPVDQKAKRLAIVEAAAAQFARCGYEATLMDDVAGAARVSKGSLYDYFRNKEDLFYAVFEWFRELLLQAGTAELKPGANARDILAAFAEGSIRAFVAHIELYPVMLDVWAAAAKTGTRKRFAKAMRELYAEYRREIASLMRAAQDMGDMRKDADVDVLASVLIGAVDGILLQYWLDPNFDATGWIRTFVNDLFEGVGTAKTRKS